MLLHGINYNIMIPNLSYLSVYQYKEKSDGSTKTFFWGGGLESNKKQKMAMHVSPTTLVMKYIYIYSPL